MRVVISAGGTGGHIYPALAIIHKIQQEEPNSEFLYIGTTDRMEHTIIPGEKIPFVGIEMRGLNRRKPWKNIAVLQTFRKAIARAKEEIEKFHPDIVVGVGGYITAPVVYSGKKLGYKTFIHEQNSISGLSNKFLSHFADKIGVSFPGSVKYFDKEKVIFTGNPRSEEVVRVAPIDKKKYHFDSKKQLVVIVMGSLGSMTMNEKLGKLLPNFRGKDYEVLFVTGEKYYDQYKNIPVPHNVQVIPYCHEMLSLLKKTDLLVSRAGASTIAEITALGLPSILVPSPYVTHNHQYKNARELELAGASKLLEEKDFSGETLIPLIDSVLENPETYRKMKEATEKLGVKDSATKIYQVLRGLVDEGKA